MDWNHLGEHGSLDLSTRKLRLKGTDLIFKKRGIDYDAQALQALLMWCESHELDISEETALNVTFWEEVGQYILAAASNGKDTAIGVIKP